MQYLNPYLPSYVIPIQNITYRSQSKTCALRALWILRQYFLTLARAYGRYGTYNFCARRLSRSNDLPGGPSLFSTCSRASFSPRTSLSVEFSPWFKSDTTKALSNTLSRGYERVTKQSLCRQTTVIIVKRVTEREDERKKERQRENETVRAV